MTITVKPEIDPAVLCACNNCAWRGAAAYLNEIADVDQRVMPGETMPAGECPDCGCLAHIDEDEGYTDTQITGFWEGGAYDGLDLRPAGDCRATDIRIAQNAAPLAVMPGNIVAVMAALQAGRDELHEAVHQHIYDADNGEQPDSDASCMKVLAQMDAALAGAVPPYRAADPWADDALFSGEDWRNEVANCHTRNGYLEWVAAKRDAARTGAEG